MIFESWYGILRILVVGPLAYASLVLLLRVSGKRTLAKLNAFDLVVTVALGSTLASVLLSKTVALLEGVTGMLVLVGLQYVVAFLCVRFKGVSDLMKSEPSLLLRNGQFLGGVLRQQRVTQAEVLSALRSAGVAEPADAAAVILETDGSLSVIKSGAGFPATLDAP